ncbi:protein prenyltransferase alpha subunit repeat-containing protein 1 isoform X5 [Homo sapiens]|uniref:protein prenyltransferase alpha subunit repeat-containing protein 1 isoform X5 n=1 Tax=Homo sapiens TaxID=9606 RepID=UPI001FB0A8EE|nr:protein prenyltransferase alpha subunit repeat-containing protein 1 isoform X5 [Homo sapiens]XP_054218905.1 protein prenyltransferase alpha subunit repeat-containing protein 1 isoform X5 [Homo sapiens]
MAETSEEVAVLVQRVVKDITNAFRRNPHIIDRCHMYPAASKPRLYHCMEREHCSSICKMRKNQQRRLLGRKELILSGTLNPIKDLHLGKLALTKFPKSPETWIHRRWVLQQLIQETSLPSFVTKGNLGTIPTERAQRLIQEEMEVCGEAAGRYPSNYNAWSHRIWVLQHLAKLDVKAAYFLPSASLKCRLPAVSSNGSRWTE